MRSFSSLKHVALLLIGSFVDKTSDRERMDQSKPPDYFSLLRSFDNETRAMIGQFSLNSAVLYSLKYRGSFVT